MVERFSHSLITSRGEDVQVEHPGLSRYASAFPCDPPLAPLLGPALRGDQGVERSEPDAQRCLPPLRMLAPLHGKALPCERMRRLSQEGAGDGPLRVGEDRIPPDWLRLAPAPEARAMGGPGRGGDVLDQVAQPLTARQDAPALALAGPGQEGVALRAEDWAPRRGESRQLLRELAARVAQAGAEARARQERPQPLGRAVEALGEGPLDPG